MAAQTWDLTLLAPIVSTGVGNTTSIGVGVADEQNIVPYSRPVSAVLDLASSSAILDLSSDTVTLDLNQRTVDLDVVPYTVELEILASHL